MKKKIIFISYFFFPNREVGANRIRFWVSYLIKFYPEVEPVVITATKFSENEKISKHQYYVKPDGHSPIGWFVKDQGLNWSKPLISFFEEHKFENLAGIVMTGGPFMQFSAIPQIKELCSCKVLIDFRDPFSDNQRFNNSWLKKRIKRYFEKRFVDSADLVVSVNKDVFETLAGFRKDDAKFHVIPNGYDDISIEKARESHNTKHSDDLKMIVAGKYYAKADPYETIQAIVELNNEGMNIMYSHYGGQEEGVKAIPANERIQEFGVTDYINIVDALIDSDIGLLISQGIQQNTPTKLFDYIGAELPILIITDGEFYSGNAHEITKDYPVVKWCKNNKDDIKQTIQEMSREGLKIDFPQRKRYSRREGLLKLLRILDVIE